MKKLLLRLSFILATALSALLLSGCAAAVMTTAKTAKGSESNIVVIVEKTENIAAISQFVVDTSGLTNDDADKQKQVAERLTQLLTEYAKTADLFHPEDKDANKVTVTVRNMKRDINERAVYAIVNVLNSNNEAIFSFASAETSEGLRTIDHIEDTFAKSAIATIKAPVATN